MPVPPPCYWEQRLRGLQAELPAWAEAINWIHQIDPGCLPTLARDMEGMEIYSPGPNEVFRPLAELEPRAVRLVILGQDPYPALGAACGRAFAIHRGAKIERSLKAILKACPNPNTCPTLDAWAAQGVLLINASPVLTDTSGKPKQPWRKFTQHLLTYIAGVANPPFVLMGKVAQSYAPASLPPDRIIGTPHPSARDGSFSSEELFARIAGTGVLISW
jgi:uracil-DNA glycosylase